MTRRCLTALTVSALLCLCGAGCRSSMTSSGFTIESHNGAQIDQGSKLLAKHVAVTDISRSSSSGLLHVSIVAANLTDKDFQCEYRYSWYDRDGHMLETTMSVWKPASFHGNAQVDMSGIAPSKSAAEYKLVLRFRTLSSRY